MHVLKKKERMLVCVFIKMRCVNISHIDSAVNKEEEVAFMTRLYYFMFIMCIRG